MTDSFQACPIILMESNQAQNTTHKHHVRGMRDKVNFAAHVDCHFSSASDLIDREKPQLLYQGRPRQAIRATL